MSEPQEFPRELLEASSQEKLDYFEKSFIAHPVMSDAKSVIKLILNHPGQTFVIFVYGPAGAGKSTLMQLVMAEITQELLPVLKVNRGHLAVASMEVTLEQSGVFNPKGHLKRSLRALEEPEELIDYKTRYNVKGIGRNDDGQLVIDSHILETELGWALENALKYRYPKIFCLDEAHHMLAYGSGHRVTTMPEAIKSLANRTKVVHGLFGTYDLLTLHDVGDQLSRRSAYIHLRRYHSDNAQDWQFFQSLVYSFLLEMPFEEVPDLLAHCPFFYQRSLGCAGTLKNWFNNALADAYSEGAKTLTLKHLERRAMSIAQCLNILKKIKEGESKHQEVEGKEEELNRELGLEVHPSSLPHLDDPQLESEQQPEQPKQEVPRRRGRPKKDVGMPNPRRHPVGEQKEEKNAG